MHLSNSIPAYSIESLKATDSESKDFDFFRFEYFAKDIEHLKKPHRHNFYTFILVTDGGGSHEIDFKTYDLIPGRLFLIAPGQVHAWVLLRKIKGFVVLFNDSFMALAKGRKVMSAWPLFRISQQCFFDLDTDEKKVWIQKLVYLENELSYKDNFARDSIFYSISSLLVRASRLTVTRQLKAIQVNQDFLYRFQELIEKYFRTLKTPKEYAEKMNVTANYLNALCKKKSGKSAGSLIRQRIMLESKRMLAHTTLSVSEIAFRLNFEDNSYFGRFFIRQAKMTPREFRNSQHK